MAKTWGDIYNAALARGEDHGRAAYMANKWEERMKAPKGIHPAKTPMEGGFSLDKFMPGMKPEDAEAFAEALESADLSDPNPPKNAAYWKRRARALESQVREMHEDMAKIVYLLEKQGFEGGSLNDHIVGTLYCHLKP